MDNLIRKIVEGAIEDMVYRDKPKDKHIRRMEKDLGPLRGFPIGKFKNVPPPPNESGETESEIEKLDSILVDDEFVESADDVDKHFENYLDSKDLEYPREEIKKYMAGVRSIILQLKYHYNRPRPGQIAQAKGMKGFDPESLKSASTPSYPSGHATQGRFIGRLLGDMFPEHKEQLIKIGDDIAYSRNMAKVHYPSDSKIGKKLGDELYDFIKDKVNLEEIKVTGIEAVVNNKLKPLGVDEGEITSEVKNKYGIDVAYSDRLNEKDKYLYKKPKMKRRVKITETTLQRMITRLINERTILTELPNCEHEGYCTAGTCTGQGGDNYNGCLTSTGSCDTPSGVYGEGDFSCCGCGSATAPDVLFGSKGDSINIKPTKPSRGKLPRVPRKRNR